MHERLYGPMILEKFQGPRAVTLVSVRAVVLTLETQAVTLGTVRSHGPNTQGLGAITLADADVGAGYHSELRVSGCQAPQHWQLKTRAISLQPEHLVL
jgi:hypothetical protein